MRSFITTFLAIALSFTSFSQNLFVRGYYINNLGQKSEGLILHKRWNNYPFDFQFKADDNAETLLLGIDSVSEFGIDGNLRFVRKNVDIDLSGELYSDLDSNRDPVYTRKLLFLRLLVDGKHRLYDYQDSNVERFFIESDTLPVTQLIYKKFMADELLAGTNRDYQKQLWKYMNCPSVTMEELSGLNYYRKELISVLMRFNKCDSIESVNLAKPPPYDKFDLTIKAGAGFSIYNIVGLGSYSYNVICDPRFTPHFGIEAEYLLPFNRHKWGITAEAGLFTYQSEGENRSFKAKVNYSSLELPVGFRYHIYPGTHTDLFFSAFYIFNHPLRLDVDYNVNILMQMKSKNNPGAGIGFRYNKKLTAEFRMMQTRYMPGDGLLWYSNFRAFWFLIGYTLF